MTRPLYIFDLDGTLADISHRLPILQDESIPKDERYRRFYAACVDDKPIASVIHLYHVLNDLNYHQQVNGLEPSDLWVWTGRSDEVKEQTRAWLDDYELGNMQLRMRPAGDHRPDHVLKEEWLHAMSPEDRARLVLVVEDRQRVVDMWRRNNVTCLQCASGNF